MRSLEGQTAFVAGGDTGLGRAVALALSARGVRIVTTGRDEKALGVTIGEVVHGGGKARHVAGDPRDAAHLSAAVERAIEVFGRLDIVVDADAMNARCTFDAAAAQLRSPGRLFVASAAAEGEREALSSLVRDRATKVLARRITVNAIVVDGPAPSDAGDDVAMEVAELAVYLCGRSADGITGQTIAIRSAP
jgi:NAD(P)-dependent dehydrogenase (short-subunit alcohol dehydrogenase family)